MGFQLSTVCRAPGQKPVCPKGPGTGHLDTDFFIDHFPPGNAQMVSEIQVIIAHILFSSADLDSSK